MAKRVHLIDVDQILLFELYECPIHVFANINKCIDIHLRFTWFYIISHILVTPLQVKPCQGKFTDVSTNESISLSSIPGSTIHLKIDVTRTIQFGSFYWMFV